MLHVVEWHVKLNEAVKGVVERAIASANVIVSLSVNIYDSYFKQFLPIFKYIFRIFFDRKEKIVKFN